MRATVLRVTVPFGMFEKLLKMDSAIHVGTHIVHILPQYKSLNTLNTI